MNSCPICFEDKEDAAKVAQLDCKHEFCQKCLFLLISTHLETKQDADFPCPMCRNISKIDQSFIRKQKIPVSCFNAETAILVEHVQTFYEHDEARETLVQIKSRHTNFRRAILQGNTALVTYWLSKIESAMNTCQVDCLNGLAIALENSSTEICRVLLKHASKMDSQETLYILSGYICTFTDSDQFTKSLSKLELLKPFYKDLKLSETEEVLYSFSRNGMVNALDWWVVNDLQVHVGFFNLHKIENVQVLNWWKENDPLFVRSLTRSSLNHVVNVEVLNWWKCNGRPFRFDEEALCNAIEKKAMDTLKWWQQSGLAISFDGLFAYKKALDTGDINIVKWVHQNWVGPEGISSFLVQVLFFCCQWNYEEIFQYTVSICDATTIIPTSVIVKKLSQNGMVDLMQWFYEWHQNTQRTFYYTETALDWASAQGQLPMLKWWFESGLPLKFTERAIDVALRRGHFDIVEYWQTKKDRVTLKYSIEMFKGDEENTGRLLEWLSSDKCKLLLDDVILAHLEKLRKIKDETLAEGRSRKISGTITTHTCPVQ